MDRSDFVDADGTVWHVLVGLPRDYPNMGEGAADGEPQAGLTFRASTGEVRVLPRAAIPRRARVPTLLAPLGTKMPTARVETPGWKELLRQALAWPPA